MARPKGKTPPRVYVNARIRKDLSDELTELTRDGNPTRSQVIERAVEMYLRSLHRKPKPK
jgi:metal-responsive CopG/Arc/MetJ family transcriptional regulator